MPPNHALILAAGSGQRMSDAVPDKILTPLQGRPVIDYSVAAFIESGCVARIGIVYRDEAQLSRIKGVLADSASTTGLDLLWVPGGVTRQESVLRGLEALPERSGLTFIHDAARPLLAPGSIQELAQTAEKDGAACLVHPLSDTIKRTENAGSRSQVILEDLQRERLWAMETPQVFRSADILRAYRHIFARGLEVTDDTAAAASLGIPVSLVVNANPNPKITNPADLSYLEWLLSQ